MNPASLINTVWMAASWPSWRCFLRALKQPEVTQRAILAGYMRANADTAYGRAYDFGTIASVAEFQRRVPLTNWDHYVPWIERIRAGEARVLTAEPVLCLAPSSGSAAARKLIPYTCTLRAEFGRGISPWMVDLFRRHPRAARGYAYWSVTPTVPLNDDTTEPVPIGFDADSAYLGGPLRRVVERAFAVPQALSAVGDIEAFRYATVLHLLRARPLALVSVWHPSFFALLLDVLPEHWERLVDDVRHGRLTPPGPLPTSVERRIETRFSPDAARAAELARIVPEQPDRIWPELGVLSCWADAHASAPATALERRFPGVPVQAKGLLATEAFMTLPFAGGRPVALRSHFFEFMDDRGQLHLLHELEVGVEYSIVVTTGGGLYRYRIGDRVQVDGIVERTPSLRFLGREDRVSDRFGEKLSEHFVSAALERLLEPLNLGVSFALLAPDERTQGVGYTLYLESRRTPRADLGARLDALLRENPHYLYCREIGQLESTRVFRVERRGHARFIERGCVRGQRMGDVKPAGLSAETGWSTWLDGAYLIPAESRGMMRAPACTRRKTA